MRYAMVLNNVLPACGWTVAAPAENGIFEPFIYKNEHFAKTGAGQT
jgi:hypothetical protein